MGRLEAKLGGEAKGVVRESVVIKVAESEDTRIERKKKVKLVYFLKFII